MLKRVPCWESRFADYLEEAKTATYEWGRHDCILFGPNAILAFTGTDVAADFRGKYHDAFSASALIWSLTPGRSVADALTYFAENHGLPQCRSQQARSGDLVIAKSFFHLFPGVVDLSGERVAYFGPMGLMRVPVEAIAKGWHIE